MLYNIFMRQQSIANKAATFAPDWRKALTEDILLNRGIRELDAPLAVCAPHADPTAAHALQHHCRGSLLDLHGRPSALKPAQQVLIPGLLILMSKSIVLT